MPLLFTRPPDAPPETLNEYRSAGGYEALSRARSGDPEEVIGLVEASGLLGRGGGGFPAARKWRAVRHAPGDEKYVVANGGEHEPGSRKDRHLVAGYPHRVIEGLALAAFATGARRAFIYLVEDMEDAIGSASRALDEAAPLLGDLEVKLVRAPATYVAGEETAALSLIEGGGPWPRPKPPLPVQAGIRGRPTVVNNVETLAMAAVVARVGLEKWGRGVMLCQLPAITAPIASIQEMTAAHGLNIRAPLPAARGTVTANSRLMTSRMICQGRIPSQPPSFSIGRLRRSGAPPRWMIHAPSRKKSRPAAAMPSATARRSAGRDWVRYWLNSASTPPPARSRPAVGRGRASGMLFQPQFAA